MRNLLNAVVKELLWNSDRKFIVVEQAFFQRFFDEADDKTAAAVRSLVASGQLEFINGGISMHDEACTSFVDQIDNTAAGHRYVLDEFNVTIKTQWQIDPFGHGVFQASQMSSPSAGYDAVFFMRADWQEIAWRQSHVTTEMIWAPSPTLGMSGATYAGILYGGYCTVGGLSMDISSKDEPLIDDPALPGYNVPELVNTVVKYAQDALTKVPQGGAGASGADIMLPLGCDFE